MPELEAGMSTEIDGQLFIVLSAVTDGESCDVVMSAGGDHGFESWRRLHRRWDSCTAGREQPELLAGSPTGDDFSSLLNMCVEPQEISKCGRHMVRSVACPAFFCSNDGDLKGLCHGGLVARLAMGQDMLVGDSCSNHDDSNSKREKYRMVENEQTIATESGNAERQRSRVRSRIFPFLFTSFFSSFFF